MPTPGAERGQRRVMASERVKFTFPQDLVNTPVIYNMGKEFGVVTNIRRANLSHDRGWVILEVVGTPIRRANLSHDRGWVILEVVGTPEAVEKSLSWAKEQGVRVEPVGAEQPT